MSVDDNLNETAANTSGTSEEEIRADSSGEEQVTTSSDVKEDAFAKELAQAKAQAAEYLDNWRRTTAELSNARKRMQREQAEFAATATARVLEKLLPVVDDMDRAFNVLPADQAEPDWVAGFRLIQRKLQSLIESEGVVAIETEGRKFDPELHYAVSHEEAEGHGEGDIIGEVAKGYKLGDRVLRPSMVRVAKG
jgi:molecular chaperone GrpE